MGGGFYHRFKLNQSQIMSQITNSGSFAFFIKVLLFS